MNTPEAFKVPVLIDARERNLQHPETFDFPEHKAKTLRIGDWAKVGASGERFWVQVTHIGNPKLLTRFYFGRIDNDLVWGSKHRLKYNETISFGIDHVLDALKNTKTKHESKKQKATA